MPQHQHADRGGGIEAKNDSQSFTAPHGGGTRGEVHGLQASRFGPQQQLLSQATLMQKQQQRTAERRTSSRYSDHQIRVSGAGAAVPVPLSRTSSGLGKDQRESDRERESFSSTTRQGSRAYDSDTNASEASLNERRERRRREKRKGLVPPALGPSVGGARKGVRSEGAKDLIPSCMHDGKADVVYTLVH